MELLNKAEEVLLNDSNWTKEQSLKRVESLVNLALTIDSLGKTCCCKNNCDNYEDCQVGCTEPTMQGESAINEVVKDYKVFMNNENVGDVIKFGNYILKQRHKKLLDINPQFTNGLESLSPCFFDVTDADVQNYKDSLLFN